MDSGFEVKIFVTITTTLTKYFTNTENTMSLKTSLENSQFCIFSNSLRTKAFNPIMANNDKSYVFL